MSRLWVFGAVGSGVLATAVALAATLSSCSQTPTNVPLRSFERPQKVDVVCMQVLDAMTLAAIPPIPVRQELCAATPAGVSGSQLPFHLFALVTQTSRGEVAVVDLTAGGVIDEDPTTPGINFLTVGALPTDVAVTPDGAMTFVGAAEVNKPAIYALPNNRILGASQGPIPNTPPATPPTLASWPVCALPQAPGPIAVVPMAPAADAGAADDGGPSAGSYVIAVVLPGDGRSSAKVVTLDPLPFLRGAGLDTSPGTVVAPASLSPCPVLGAVELSANLPSTAGAGPRWDDGVKYVDGGVDLTPLLPTPAANCLDGGELDGAGDGGTGSSDFGPLPPPRPTAAARAGQTLFVADGAMPLVHVVDLSNPASPQEIAPLVATSQLDPTRLVAVGDLAVSPPTRDYKQFLYALDMKDNPASLMVFDVTDPVHGPRLPLTRPHPEVNPFQPPDRISFSAPIAAVTFVKHDFPLDWGPTGPVPGQAPTGLLCNPNPNAGLDQGEPPFPFRDPGAAYRANVNNQPVPLGPSRLRGIFAFATLSNGQVMIIDVDDWDAPCRRPDPMAEGGVPSACADSGAPVDSGPPDASEAGDGGEADAGDGGEGGEGGEGGGPTEAGPPSPPPLGAPSDIAPVEPSACDSNDLDPYHVPNAYAPTSNNTADPTTQEAYFPVSAPHRPRSFYYLRNDPTTGLHIPNVPAIPQLFNQNATIPPGGANPIMLPTSTTLADPIAAGNASYDNTVGVRFAYEDPLVQIDQSWTVTYEGKLPPYEGLAGDLSSPDGTYQTLVLSVPNGLLCRKGVEDQDQGVARAQAVLAEMASRGLPSPDGLAQFLVDYVQIADEMLDPTDPYWREDNACWPAGLSNSSDPNTPGNRYNACFSAFGCGSTNCPGLETPQRDFPILQAYDDHFILGRFSYPDGLQSPGTRISAPQDLQMTDANNPSAMQALQCCFHNQATFHVRAGGEWLTLGSVVGLLEHMQSDVGGRCVPSCDPADALLNARAVGLIPPGMSTLPLAPNRNSPLAMRNPMFSFVMWNGTPPMMGPQTRPTRDWQWQFSTSGQFVPYAISIAAGTTAVAPQSMLFIDSIQQLAIVDGSSQGLVLIDLNTVAFAHAPYF